MDDTSLKTYLGIALYPYLAEESDELTINVGDRIELLNLNEDNWWLAKIDEKVGLVPGNYVKQFDEFLGSSDLMMTNGMNLQTLQELRLEAQSKIDSIKEDYSNGEKKLIESIKNITLIEEIPSKEFLQKFSEDETANLDSSKLIANLEVDDIDSNQPAVFRPNNNNITYQPPIINKLKQNEANSTLENSDEETFIDDSIPNLTWIRYERTDVNSKEQHHDEINSPITKKNQKLQKKEIKRFGASSGIRYPHCKSVVFPPTNADTYDDSLQSNPTSEMKIEKICGYNGGGQEYPTIKSLPSGHILYPAATVLVAINNNKQQSFFVGHTERISCVSSHPLGGVFASGQIGSKGIIYLWDLIGTKPIIVYIDKCNVGVKCIDFSGDGDFLLAMDESSSIVVFDWINSPNPVIVTKASHTNISRICFNPYAFETIVTDSDSGCHTFVTIGGDSVKFWTLTPAMRIENEDISESPLTTPNMKKGAKVSKTSENLIYKFSIKGMVGHLPKSNISETPRFTCITFIQDESSYSRILTGTASGSVYIWNQLRDDIDNEVKFSSPKKANKSWTCRSRLLSVVTDVHTDVIVDILYFNRSIDDKRIESIVTCCEDSNVCFWNLNRSDDVNALPISFESSLMIESTTSNISYAKVVEYDHTSDALLFGTSDSMILEVQCSKKKKRFDILVSGNSKKITQVTMHPNLSNIFATVGFDKVVRIWDVFSYFELSVIYLSDAEPEDSTSETYRPTCVAFVPNTCHIMIGNTKGEICLIAVRVLDTLHEVEWPDDNCTWFQIAKRIINKASVKQRDNIDLKKINDRSQVTLMKFSPDGNLFAVACKDRYLYILSVSKQYKRQAVCKGHKSIIKHFDFSEDNLFIQSADNAKEILFWDVRTGKMIGDSLRYRDIKWSTFTCLVGWPVQGVFNNRDFKELSEMLNQESQRSGFGYGKRSSNIITIKGKRVVKTKNTSEATANCVSRSNDGKLIAVGGHQFVKLFNFPCLLNAIPQLFLGHAGAVLDISFTSDDSRILSVGGSDHCIIQWRLDKKR